MAAAQGLGEALAHRLGKEGAHVLVADIADEKAEAVARKGWSELLLDYQDLLQAVKRSEAVDLVRQTIQIAIDEMYHALELGIVIRQMGGTPSFRSDEVIRYLRIVDNLDRDRQTEDRLELIQLLRRAHKKRKAKGIGRKERKTKIPNRIRSTPDRSPWKAASSMATGKAIR
jgi:hypothetical protein